MMRKLFLLLLALLCCTSAFAEEEIYIVGGSTLEEAIQMMPGYQIETDSDGTTLAITDLAVEYFVQNSENGTAVLPLLIAGNDFYLHLISFTWPAELTKVSKVVITTDNNIHTIINKTPWTYSEQESMGYTIMLNSQMVDVLFEMSKSENVKIEYFKDASTNKAYELTMEQKFLLRQYIYVCDTFFPKPVSDATSIYLALMGDPFGYTVTSTSNPDAPKTITNTNTTVSEVSLKEQLQEYKSLLDDGLITQEDYDEKKKQLLGL